MQEKFAVVQKSPITVQMIGEIIKGVNCTMRWFLLAIYFITLSLPSPGQDFSYTQYNVKDGLAGSVVYCAAEDKDGFLWFGTGSGLSRFDGTHFRNFTTADGLPDNEIIKVFVDSRNRIWIAPFRNSICYYQKGRLHNQDNDLVLHQLSIAGEVIVMTEDKYGNIILVEPSAVHIITPHEEVKNITQTREGQNLYFQIGGLNPERQFGFFATEDGHRTVQYVIDRDSIKCLGEGDSCIYTNGINTSLLSPDLNIFRGKDSLYLIQASTKRISIGTPRDLNSLSKIDDSLFTLNTTNGAYLYNLRARATAAHLLKGQSINAAMRDSEGNLWFMSTGGGIFRIGSLGFRNIVFRDGNDQSVTAIQNINGDLYIGTERSSLWRADLALRQIQKEKISWRAIRLGRIMTIAPTHNRSLLLGTDACLIRLDDLSRNQSLDQYAVKTIVLYKDAILISSSNCVELRDPFSLKTTRHIWTGRSTCSCRQDSLFYIGTISGLYSLVAGGAPHFWGDRYPVFRARISAIATSADGTVWVSTWGQGIAGVRNGGLAYWLSEKDGLTSNICSTIFTCGNDIWVGGDKGLNRVHMEGAKFRITSFRSSDGLSSDIINTVYVHKDDVYVGSDNGLTHFNVNEMAEPSFCKLRITSIHALGRNWDYDTTGLVLPHHESSIRVDFVGVSYRSAGGITYKYRLKGLDDNWQTTRETFLSYPTLPSGRYDLEIIATNKFGVQSVPIRVAFIVQKLLWEKAWFLCLVVVFMAGLVWAVVWLRIGQLKRKNAERISINNRMAELEQMSLRAQMNPHFIFNNLNSIQKYVMEKDIVGANKFITDFSRLIRLTLEITSKSRISIEEELTYLSGYLELEKARFGDIFRYEISLSPGIDKRACFIPPMVLQPYVENSIRHGLRYREDDKGVVLIRFVENGSHLVCTIEDNGVGRSQAQQFKGLSPIEYQSRGMTLTQRRMEMMNHGKDTSISIDVEDLETEERKPMGTRIILRFPLQYVKI